MEEKSTKPQSTQSPSNKWDNIPIFLKAISGFNSCLTVSATSAIFIWSIHVSVSKGIATWPGIITALIMMAGPIIIAWSFVNARGIITTILPQQDESGNVVPGSAQVAPTEVKLPVPIPIVTADDVAFERELVGPVAVMLRAIAGATSTHVICFCSLLFTWTIHDSMLSGRHLPSDSELLLVVVGPVVTSWNFVRASMMLSTVMQGASGLNRYRTKLAAFIQPK